MFVGVETGTGGPAAGEAPPGGLTEALHRLDAAIDGLDSVDLGAESDEELLAAVVAGERLSARVAFQQLRLLDAADRRESYAADGAIGLTSWYRSHAHLDFGDATRRVQAASRLARFPLFAAASAAGDVSLAHVMALTKAAVYGRVAAIAEHEDTLVRLAKQAPPRDLRVALQRIADHADRDGADEREQSSGCGPDPRREFGVRAVFDGLGEVHGWLDQVDTELLLTLLDALDEPDPDGTPWPGRTAGQRRADAFGRLLRLVADAGAAPTVGGVKPHLLLTLDLARLLGVPPDHPHAGDLADLLARVLAGHDIDPAALADLLAAMKAAAADHTGDPAAANDCDADVAGPAGEPAPERVDFTDLLDPDPAASAGEPRLRRTGPLDPHKARCVARDAKVTAVLTMGPWRIVNVGRTMRTLPPWLRPMLDTVHRHCRGPHCDRPATWTEAHHVTAWADQGITDLNHTVPLCQAHHHLVTSGRWRLDYNPSTGACTWTGPQGQIHTTRPPP